MAIVSKGKYKDAVQGEIIKSFYDTVSFMGSNIYKIRQRMQENKPDKIKEFVWKEYRKSIYYR